MGLNDKPGKPPATTCYTAPPAEKCNHIFCQGGSSAREKRVYRNTHTHCHYAVRVVSPPYLWPLIQPVQFKELQSFRTHTLVITLKALEITDRRKLQGRWGMCTEWYLSAFEHTYKDLVLNPSSKTLKCVYLHNSSSHDLSNYVFRLPDSIIFIKINTLQKIFCIIYNLASVIHLRVGRSKVTGISKNTHTPVLTNLHTNSKYYELMIWSFLGCLPIDFIQRLHSVYDTNADRTKPQGSNFCSTV